MLGLKGCACVKMLKHCRSVVCLFREEKVNVNISRGSKDVERLVWTINFHLKPWSASKDVHELRYWRWSLTRRVRYQRQFATPQEVLRLHCDMILFWKENRDIILFSKGVQCHQHRRRRDIEGNVTWLACSDLYFSTIIAGVTANLPILRHLHNPSFQLHLTAGYLKTYPAV